MTIKDETPIDERQDGPPSTFGEGQSKQGDIRAARIEVIATANDKVNMTEPSTPNHPQYPWCKTYQGLSGHIREEDDTPGAERILDMHKSGTFTEVHADGSKVTKIFGKDFYLILDDHTLFVGGNINISVQGNANLLVKGDLITKVGGNMETTVHGHMTTRVTGKTLHYGKDDIDVQSAGNISVKSDKQIRLQSTLEMNFNTAANLVARAGGQAIYHSDGVTYIDGSQTHINLPGPNPPKGALVKMDPGAGLNVPDSLIQPSIESQFAVRTDNNAMVSTISTDVTFPKDRKPIK